jgi:CubicO group peptidase (beta-lactamase class C family)
MARLPVVARLSILSTLLLSACGAETGLGKTEELRDLMAAGNLPGLQVARVEGGGVVEDFALGVVDAEEGVPVTASTVFEAASLSKPVSAYIAFRLVDRGELDLDTPLWEILEYSRLAHDERAQTITPRMVLSHTTGLPNWGGTPLELINDPGQEWGYSGEGFVFLQRAMERLTDRSLQELAEAEVFGPLGMGETSFVWRDSFDTLKATGHDELGRPVSGLRRPDGANAAASLHTTARDYGRFLGAVLQGEGLSESSRSAMIEQASDADTRGPDEALPHVAWGLGWGVQDSDRGRSIWHWGDNGIFRAFVVGYPDTGDGVVYLTNSEAGLSVTEDLLRVFFSDTFWAARWLEYPQWDHSAWKAYLALRRSFLDGHDEGMLVLDSLREELGSEVDQDLLPGLMRFLAEEGESESALHLAGMAVRSAPENPEVRVLLAEIQTGGRLYAEATATYREALQLGADPEEVEPRIAWLEEGLASTGEVNLLPQELEAMAGTYGPRQFRVEDGVLRYSRDGGPETTLIPLSRNLFALESNATFRLQFEEGPDGVFRKVHGLYSDGRRDESVRTPPAER